jgi:molybdopterin synthase sulfurtransferase
MTNNCKGALPVERGLSKLILAFMIAIPMMGCGSSTSASKPSTPSVKAAQSHPEALVDPAWINALIQGGNPGIAGTPSTYPGNGYVIVYTSWYPRYQTNEISTTGAGLPFATTGHIPGAIFLDTYSIETGPTSEYGAGYASPSNSYVKELPVLQAFFASMGITKDKTVIVYADDDISTMTAGRIAWGLLYAGVNDVRILNGGYKAWVASGNPVETGTTAWAPVADFGISSGHPEYLATTKDLFDVINGINTSSMIVDDRAWEEYTGATNSYYWWFDEKGRIPTAKWIGDWVDISSADAQSFISFEETKYKWTQSGFSPNKKMYFYCGGGARSAMYTFYSYMMGWPAANYEGGWYLWSTTHANPRETGIPN